MLTVNFSQCFAFDADVTSPHLRLGHLTIHMLEVSDSCRRANQIVFWLRSLQ